MYYDRAV
jgi:long-chain-fatty-acid--CoA ligase ACSBG